MKKKALLSWSSGKDSAWALHLLQQDPRIEILGLFTVMNQKY
ncbi:MAG: ATP-binding protein, partial [Planctomycetota bacterium]